MLLKNFLMSNHTPLHSIWNMRLQQDISIFLCFELLIGLCPMRDPSPPAQLWQFYARWSLACLSSFFQVVSILKQSLAVFLLASLVHGLTIWVCGFWSPGTGFCSWSSCAVPHWWSFLARRCYKSFWDNYGGMHLPCSCPFYHSPAFWAIQKHWLYIAVVEPYLGLQTVLPGLPDGFKSAKGRSCLVQSGGNIFSGSVVITYQASKVCEVFNTLESLSINNNLWWWCWGVDAHHMGLVGVDLKTRLLGIVAQTVVFSCMWVWLVDRTARSSAKSRSSRWLNIFHWIPRGRSDIVWHMIQSIVIRNRMGERTQPWRTPDFIWNASETVSSTMMLHSKFS